MNRTKTARATPWYVAERAQSLAVVFLTRQPGILVRKAAPSESPFDLILTLSDDPGRADWTAAVVVRGVKAPPRAGFDPGLSDRERHYLSETDMPVVLLVMDVRDERYYFGWLKRPGAGRNGRAARLDDAAADGRVEVVEIGNDDLRGRLDEIAAFYRSAVRA